jgi:mono/diheme cytochrome c family protein
MPRLASPRAVLLVTLAVVLALDVARSVYARLAYDEPYQVWDPPDPYARIAWPPGSDVRADAPLGARVFARRCAVCHGPEGKGNGPAAPSLHPRPRDLTSGELKYRTTPPGTPPSGADILRTVREGHAASAMPYFSDVLSDEELRGVVEHARGLMGVSGPDEPSVPVPPRPPADGASVARGEALYAKACASCHGPDLRGGGPYQDVRATGSQVLARDLTAPWTFRGGGAPEQVWLRLTTGMTPGPMPSYADALSPGERWDLVAFIASRARPPPWAPGGKLAGPGQSPDLLRRGDYLLRAEMCSLCHTQIDRTGIYRHEGWWLAGGMRVQAGAHGTFVSQNLTPDETGLGGETAEEIAHTLRTGRHEEGTLDPWGMPWWMLAAFTEEDALAIATRLKALPPVRHRVPEPLELGSVETVVRKLGSPLPAAVPMRLTYAAGDFADPEARPGTRAAPAHALVLAQRVVLALGLIAAAVAWIKARRAGRELPRGGRGWRVAGAVLAVVALAVAWLVSRLPQIIPAPQLAAAIHGAVPRPDPAALGGPERAALVERGRYLFSVTSCLFCHGPDGAGGTKVSWRPFGTLYVRNLTSDRETGLGAWTDAQIARAIRSGVSRDGRQLHWQGMTWDLLSNLDEEDVRAIVAYLRALPPVRKAIPPPRPPSPDDCEVYTFFLRGDVETPGCR